MSAFDERMAQLRARFVVRAAEQREQLTAALMAGDRDEVRRLAHGLSGSAGVFGFPEISVDAQAVEEAVDEGASDEELKPLASKLLDRLAAASQDAD
ncbi:MAG TPA: Hpt domain-containing protein [Allosphingosinicella sp.]|uniref:Hpt domain-containing protein n=1 Tax=Allosphingosinicella sp. TaxID=2823234 RepID=UPI002ED928A6